MSTVQEIDDAWIARGRRASIDALNKHVDAARSKYPTYVEYRKALVAANTPPDALIAKLLMFCGVKDTDVMELMDDSRAATMAAVILNIRGTR